MVPKPPTSAAPTTTLTLAMRMDCIARLADGEAKADIAAALGLPSGRYVQPVAIANKADVERVRKAAPHDREGVLASIRQRLEGKGVASA